jgi:hypothetical protein
VNFYEHWILPPLLDRIMRQRQLEKHRGMVVASARGRVLEIGIGSGLDFPLYSKRAEIIFGIDPSPPCLRWRGAVPLRLGYERDFCRGLRRGFLSPITR